MAELESKQEESEQEDQRPLTLGTDCKECIFFEGSKSCKLGKIAKFEEQGAYFEEIDDKFMVDRVCNFRRTKEWQKEDSSTMINDNARYKSIEQCMGLVKEEVKISGSIVVYAEDLDRMKQCISKLSKIKHVENFKIIIAHYSGLAIKDVLGFIEDQDFFKEILAVRVNEIDTHKGEIHFLDEAFKRAKNGFIFVIDSSKDFDENILDKIKHWVYDEMGRLLYVKSTEENSVAVYMAVIYQFLKGYRFGNFDDKLEGLSRHQALETQIMTWDQINEKYSN